MNNNDDDYGFFGCVWPWLVAIVMALAMSAAYLLDAVTSK